MLVLIPARHQVATKRRETLRVQFCVNMINRINISIAYKNQFGFFYLQKWQILAELKMMAKMGYLK